MMVCRAKYPRLQLRVDNHECNCVRFPAATFEALLQTCFQVFGGKIVFTAAGIVEDNHRLSILTTQRN